jgi:hypothetical protein
VDSVHGSWTMGGVVHSGPRIGLGGGSPELSLAAALGHDGLLRGWQLIEGDVARPRHCPPELG